MSIIMTARKATAATTEEHPSEDNIEPNIRELLDHIAVELAAEYVRLMEAAAETDRRDDS